MKVKNRKKMKVVERTAIQTKNQQKDIRLNNLTLELYNPSPICTQTRMLLYSRNQESTRCKQLLRLADSERKIVLLTVDKEKDTSVKARPENGVSRC